MAMTITSTRSRAPHLGPERRRPQVLDEALAIAVDVGLGAVTIGAVAQRMGVTRPVVYSCFADRVELVDALLAREVASLVASVLDALHSSAGIDDPEEAFARGFQALLVAAAEQPDTWRLILLGEPDLANSARFGEARALVKEKTTAWIAPAMRRWWQTEDLDRKLPVLIELFMATCESAIRSLVVVGSEWQPTDLGDFVGRAVFRAFRDA